MAMVMVTGGPGVLVRALMPRLVDGHRLRVLTRRPAPHLVYVSILRLPYTGRQLPVPDLDGAFR